MSYIYKNNFNGCYIPNDIIVGYNHRTDTLTGLLAFITYKDNKGVLKKEKDFNKWSEKENETYRRYNHINREWEDFLGKGKDDFTNTPTQGFVIDKMIGGKYSDRIEYIRVVDPRGFTVEIKTENLLYILQECECHKGKGLEGEFVYGWDVQALVLIPVGNNLLYNQSKKRSDEIHGSVIEYKTSDIELGDGVLMNDGHEYICLNDYSTNLYFSPKENDNISGRFFYNVNTKEYKLFTIYGKFIKNVFKNKYNNDKLKVIQDGLYIDIQQTFNIPRKLNYYLYEYLYTECNYNTFINANDKNYFMLHNDILYHVFKYNHRSNIVIETISHYELKKYDNSILIINDNKYSNTHMEIDINKFEMYKNAIFYQKSDNYISFVSKKDFSNKYKINFK